MAHLRRGAVRDGEADLGVELVGFELDGVGDGDQRADLRGGHAAADGGANLAMTSRAAAKDGSVRRSER